jgi:hydroxyacylglutathione hydrolase
MILEKIVVGDLFTNCYIIGDSTELAIVDPGADPDIILKSFEKLSGDKAVRAKNTVVLLTHNHVDHIGAVGEVAGALKCPIYMHGLDSDWLKEMLGSKYPGLHDIEDKEFLKVGGLSLEVLHTPGHTKGSVCFYDKKDAVLLSGDTLFAGGIGRTDLEGGSDEEMIASLKKLMLLPDDTIVYPGHDAKTTIAKEREILKAMGIV